MSDTTFLYLLLDRDAPAFKIGISIHPNIRTLDLQQRIDLPRSLQFSFSGGEARRCERALHFLFRGYAYDGQQGEGSTEWFHMEALAEAKRFIWSYRKLLGWRDWTYLSDGEVAKEQQRRLDRARAQRARRDRHKVAPTVEPIAWTPTGKNSRPCTARMQAHRESLTRSRSAGAGPSIDELEESMAYLSAMRTGT